MEQTRTRILKMLKRNGGSTIGELSELLDASATAVRRHLKALEAQGLVYHRMEQRGPGRPSYVYELKAEGPDVFKGSYVAFVDSIRQEMVTSNGHKPPHEVFDRHQAKRQEHYVTVTQGETLPDRVAVMARLMESEGRMATWQQLNEDRFILREHNCPFHRFDGDFDYPCHWEQDLLEQTLQANIKRLCHIRQGDVACVYEIEKQPAGRIIDFPEPQHAARPDVTRAA